MSGRFAAQSAAAAAAAFLGGSVRRRGTALRWVFAGSAIAAFALAPVPVVAEDAAAAQPEAAPAPATVPVSKSYRESVRALIALSNPEVIGQQVAYSVAQETLGAIAATGMAITEDMQRIVFEASMQDFGTRFSDLDYLTELYAPIYAQHMSEADVKALLAFYDTDAGRRSLTALPVIAQAAMFALQQDSLARIPDFQARVDEKLRQAGIVVAP